MAKTEEEKLLLMKKELVLLEHKSKMEFAGFVRETERMKHEWEKERQRIKTAEIRKSQIRKQGDVFRY